MIKVREDRSFIHVVREQTAKIGKSLSDGKSVILNGANNIGKATFYNDVMKANGWEDLRAKIKFSKAEEIKRKAIMASSTDLFYVIKADTGIEMIGLIKSLYSSEEAPEAKMTIIIYPFDKVLNGLKDEQKKVFLNDIKELMCSKVYKKVTVFLVSRLRMGHLFSDVYKKYPEDIISVSLGGFNKKEQDAFFDFLKNEDVFSNITAGEWNKIQEIFEKYAGTHPYLLNSARNILLDVQQEKEDVSAQRLEEEILKKLEQGKESNFGRVYYRLDEDLLGKEYYKVGKKKISGRKLFIQAFSEKSGYTIKQKQEWQMLLYNDGYALEYEGVYKPISPYMVEFLDKWTKKETKRLMTKCDKVELAIRKLLTESLVELKGSYAAAEEYLEKLLCEITDNKASNYVKFSKLEYELNGTKPDKNELLALVTLSFDDYLEIMKGTWEFPHFSRFPVYGEYVSLFEGLNHKLFDPLLWSTLLQNIRLLQQKEGYLTLEEAESLKKEWNTLLDNFTVWINNLGEGEDECFVLVMKLYQDMTELKEDIANEKDRYLSDELILRVKKIYSKLCYVKEYSKDNDIITAVDAILETLESEEFTLLIKNKDKKEFLSVIEKIMQEYKAVSVQMFPNFLIYEFGSEQAYSSQKTEVTKALGVLTEFLKNPDHTAEDRKNYEEAKNTLIDFHKHICNLHEKVKEKGNGRRISLTRVRNVAAHRHNLEVLNIRRYSGVLKECDMLLSDIKEGKALRIPKICDNCTSFRLRPETFFTDSDWIEGEFVYADKSLEKKYPKITGWIEKSKLQNRTELPIDSLEWTWNKEKNAFEVEIAETKYGYTTEKVTDEEFTLSNIQQGKKGKHSGILNGNPMLEASISTTFSNCYKEITGQATLPDTLTGLVYQIIKEKDGKISSRNFIPWEVYSYYLPIYNQIKELKRFFEANVKNPGDTASNVNSKEKYYKGMSVTFECEAVIKHKGKAAWKGKIDGENDNSILIKAVEGPVSFEKAQEGKHFPAKIKKVAGDGSKVTYIEVELTGEETTKDAEVTVDKELIPLSEIKFTLTDLEMLKTEYMESTSEKKVSVKKYDFKKNKEMKAYFKVLKGVLGVQVTDEIFLSWMQAKGYRSFLNSPNMEESFILNREIMQKYYKYLQNSRLFLTELECLERVYTDAAGARTERLSVNEFEKKMKEVNPRDEKNTVIRMVERFFVRNGKDCFTILKKNDAEDRVSIDWNAFDGLLAYLRSLPEEV